MINALYFYGRKTYDGNVNHQLNSILKLRIKSIVLKYVSTYLIISNQCYNKSDPVDTAT